MAKITLTEDKLRQLISESVKRVLSEDLENEGIFGRLIGRTEYPFDVRKSITCPVEGGWYKFDSKTKTFFYVDPEGGQYDTKIGYKRKLNGTTDERVTKQEKQDVLNQLRKWNRDNPSQIQRGQIADRNFSSYVRDVNDRTESDRKKHQAEIAQDDRYRQSKAYNAGIYGGNARRWNN